MAHHIAFRGYEKQLANIASGFLRHATCSVDTLPMVSLLGLCEIAEYRLSANVSSGFKS